MGFSVLRATLFAVATSLTSVANAGTITLKTIGPWEAYGGTDVQGVPTCGIINRGDDRSFAIRTWVGAQKLTVQVQKRSWNIPKDAKIGIKVQFDDHAP